MMFTCSTALFPFLYNSIYQVYTWTENRLAFLSQSYILQRNKSYDARERERERIKRSKRVEDDDEEDFAMAVYTRKGRIEKARRLCVFSICYGRIEPLPPSSGETDQKGSSSTPRGPSFSLQTTWSIVYRVCSPAASQQKREHSFPYTWGRYSLYSFISDQLWFMFETIGSRRIDTLSHYCYWRMYIEQYPFIARIPCVVLYRFWS